MKLNFSAMQQFRRWCGCSGECWYDSRSAGCEGRSRSSQWFSCDENQSNWSPALQSPLDLAATWRVSSLVSSLTLLLIC